MRVKIATENRIKLTTQRRRVNIDNCDLDVRLPQSQTFVFPPPAGGFVYYDDDSIVYYDDNVTPVEYGA